MNLDPNMALMMMVLRQGVLAAAMVAVISVVFTGAVLAPAHVAGAIGVGVGGGVSFGDSTPAGSAGSDQVNSDRHMPTQAGLPSAPLDPPIQLAMLINPRGEAFEGDFQWHPELRFTRQELLDMSLSALRQGTAAVPPVYLNRFPVNLATLNSPKQRKDIFIKTVLPLVLRANDEVRAERQRMLSLIARAREHGVDGALTRSEQAFLDRLAVEYEVSGADLAELQQRVDVIPASLALAQGAEESGWGTSRFARQGNAVFGQRTFRKGAGLVPLRREQGQRYEVKAFNNLYKSVRAYVWNLNTHFAYEKFRAKRAAFRDGGQPLDSYALTGTLDRYSERGEHYIKTIRVILRANRLNEFDDVELLPVSSPQQPS